MQNLPFFVYGTLRTGEGNWGWALCGRTDSEERAFFDGGQMYNNHGGFPFVVRNSEGEGRITGDLMRVKNEEYDRVLADLDRLEGYTPGSARNLYDRQVVTVTTADGEQVDAWVYVVTGLGIPRVTALPQIPSGDWMNRSRSPYSYAM